nr:MAG TPA: RNAse domain protein [Caudoviricetes sp.]
MNLLKRLFCDHSRQRYIGSYLEKDERRDMRTRHIWQCKSCGKRFWR